MTEETHDADRPLSRERREKPERFYRDSRNGVGLYAEVSRRDERRPFVAIAPNRDE